MSVMRRGKRYVRELNPDNLNQVLYTNPDDPEDTFMGVEGEYTPTRGVMRNIVAVPHYEILEIEDDEPNPRQ